MALPNRVVSGRPVIGFTAHELLARNYVVKGIFADELSERSLTIAINQAPAELLALAQDCSDDQLVQFHRAFPHSDFARIQTSQPHPEAVAARTASISEIIRLVPPRTSSITLVGPSPAQASRFRTSFPNARICVFQPRDTARDVARWRDANVPEVNMYSEMWTAATAVRSQVVISLFSAGCIHPSDFARACVAAKAKKAFVLHHWSAQSLVHKHIDPIFKCTFERSGDIEVSFRDAPSYHDSADCAIAWLSGDIRAAGHSLMVDVVVNFSSLKLLAITIAPGLDEGHRTNMLSLLTDYRVLPAVEQYSELIIDNALWEAVMDYAARQREDLLQASVIRNRLTSLKHKVSIGATIIQNAIYCSDDAADHIALIAVRFIRTRAAIAERQQQLFERGQSVRAADPISQIASHLDRRSGGALTAIEVASRAAINLNIFSAVASKALSGSWQAVSFFPAIPRSEQETTLERLVRRSDTLSNDLASMSRLLSDRITPIRAHSSDYLFRVRIFKNEVIVPYANECFWNLVVFLSRFAPRTIRTFVLEKFAFLLNARVGNHNVLPIASIRSLLQACCDRIPMGFLLIDELLDVIFRFFGYEMAMPVRGLHVRSETSSGSSLPSSSSDNDDDSDGDEAEGILEPVDIVVDLEPDIVGEPELDAAAPEEDLVEAALDVLGNEAIDPVDDGQVHEADETVPQDDIPDDIVEHILTGPIDLNRPCNIEDQPGENPIDVANPVRPFPDVAFSRARSFDYQAPATPRYFRAGPNSLKRSIIAALARTPSETLSREARNYLGKNTHAIQNAREKRKKVAKQSEEMSQFSGRVKAALSQPLARLRKIDLVINGLPAAAKSSVMRYLLHPEDAIVCQTRVHRDKWRADLKRWGIRATVVMQHQLILDPALERYRTLWIDECFLLEIKHVLALTQYAMRTVALGDNKQISSFSTRSGVGISKTQQSFPITALFANTWIEAPYSLGLPVDVLIVGKKLGFVQRDALTLNRRKAMTIVESVEDFEDGMHIVFNQDNKVGDAITAHESQGQRPDVANVCMLPGEVHFLRTGHFWVAISRPTVKLNLYLAIAALNEFNRLVNTPVQGFYRRRSEPDAVITDGSLAHLQLDTKLHRASVALIIAEKGLSADALTYEEIPRPDGTDTLDNTVESSMHLSRQQLDAALSEVNDNFAQIAYKEVVEETELTMPKELTQKLQVVLDLKAGVREATSTLMKAGVYFSSDDTKTEFFTIATRYLSQNAITAGDPQALSDKLFDSWMLAYVDPRKLSRCQLPGAAHTYAWYKSRTASLFNPNAESFCESSQTTVFSSFLKAHAKAKNDPGFGAKIEKGQTIAAGDQSYNIRHTAYCRELQLILGQITYDDVVFDIGLSDEEFEARCEEQGAHSEENTQIDLSSQDSTHFEHHVLMFVRLLCEMTSISAEHALEYYTMRSRFTVRAKGFTSTQVIKYEVCWNLPSGDPYTLVANCIQESCSIAYIFQITPLNRKFICFKGDDTYTKMLLLFLHFEQIRCAEVGVLLKLDHFLPPFFAGRYILHDNTVHHDPVKHAAKYSVKRFDPTKISEYLMAYRQLFPPISLAQADLLVQYGKAHHPSMSEQSIIDLSCFARSLRFFPCFIRFQSFAGLSAQFVDPPTNCARTVFGALHLPKPRYDPTAMELVRHCLDLHLDYCYYPEVSHHYLRAKAQRFPNRPVFSDKHCLVFLSETRYSAVQHL